MDWLLFHRLSEPDHQLLGIALHGANPHKPDHAYKGVSAVHQRGEDTEWLAANISAKKGSAAQRDVCTKHFRYVQEVDAELFREGRTSPMCKLHGMKSCDVRYQHLEADDGGPQLRPNAGNKNHSRPIGIFCEL